MTVGVDAVEIPATALGVGRAAARIVAPSTTATAATRAGNAVASAAPPMTIVGVGASATAALVDGVVTAAPRTDGVGADPIPAATLGVATDAA